MSPEAFTSERVYAGLKRDILGGRFAPETILIVRIIADEAGTSIAPVRDSMQRLVGERLLEPHPGGGFRMPQVTKEGLRQLYLWHGQLIRLALKTPRSGTIHTEFRPSFDTIDADDSHAIAEATAELFLRIARYSGNAEHVEAVRSAGERLHATRLRETPISNRLAELELVWTLTVSGRNRDAQEAIRTYHRRRLRQVSMLAGDSNMVEGRYPKGLE